MSDLIIRNAEVRGLPVDVRVRAAQIVETGSQLAAGLGEEIVDARGRALIPGLHDHHIHLLACAAAEESVALGPPHPAAQRLSRAADLARNRVDRRPLRRMFRLVVKYHAHGAITHLR